MTKRILDYDPLNKTTTYFEYLPSEDVSVTQVVQDVTPNLEWSKGLAKDDDYTKKGIKKEFWHYASIPDSVMYEMIVKHGVDVNDTKALFKAVDLHYPYLKATTKKHR